MSIFKKIQPISDFGELEGFNTRHRGIVPGTFNTDVRGDELESSEPIRGNYFSASQPDGSHRFEFSATDPEAYPQTIVIDEFLLARGAVSVISRHELASD